MLYRLSGRIPLVSTLLVLVISLGAAAQDSFVDPNFDPGSGADGGFVESVVVQRDGKILVCGNFTSFNGQPNRHVARLNSDGSLDPTFRADVGYWVRSMALQTDGKVVIGGFFTDVNGVRRDRVARLNSDGSVDLSFNPGSGCQGRIVPADPTEPFVFAVAVEPDGKILIGGNFTTYNGAPRNCLARLNPNGSLDGSFDVGSGMNSWVRSLMVESNGRILVSGWFTTYNNRGHNRMVILDGNGVADPNFNPNFGDSTAVYSMAPLPDGKFAVSGHSINTNAPFLKEVERLNPNGSFDPTFNPSGSGANDKTEVVLLLNDGKFFIAGYFNTYNDQLVRGVARLNSDGTLDASFNPQVNNWVFSAALQANGEILICGGFSRVDHFARGGVARILPSIYAPPPPPPPPPPQEVKPIAGTYTGVFFETEQPQHRSSGMVTLTMTAKGTFSGKMMLEGGASSFSGRFSTNGEATVRVMRRGKSTLVNLLTFNPSDQRVEGVVSNDTWTAPLQADRAVWNATNKSLAYAGQYTLAIAGSGDSSTAPGGDGYGIITVNQLGVLRLTGVLADGTAFSQQATLSKDGLWPLYVSLYGGRGSVVGWLAFTNAGGTLGGNVDWVRPAARTVYYPNGFNLMSSAIGSRYVVVPGNAINLTSATVTLTGGNLADTVSIPVTVGPTRVVPDGSSTNGLKMTIDRRNGVVQGSFVNPSPRKLRTIRGVILQNQWQARGFFLGTNQSGGMVLE